MRRLITNIIGFQIGWFSCIIAARHGVPLVGIAVVAVVCAVHLCVQKRPRAEAGLILLVAVAGIAADTVLHLLGLLTLAERGRPDPMFTLWIAALWINFAMTLTTTFGWLHRHYILAALLGLLGGPTTYYAGVALGAIEFHPQQGFTWAALSAEWVLAMPLAVWAAHRLNPCPSRSDASSEISGLPAE